MNLAWQSIKLSHALIKSDEWIEVDPSQTYQQVTVKMWGKGVELRNNVLGSTIAASKRLQVHPEQFILSRIDARHGAFGLIPESLDRALVTNDFPVFNLNRELLLPEFLNWLSKTGNFVDICRMASEGTTNRVRLKEDKFLSTEIRLPPIAEQRRIVAHIEELAAKIEEARGLREGAIEQLNFLIGALNTKLFSEIEEAKIHLVEEFCDVRGGIQKSSKRTPGKNPRRYLTVAHVQRNWIDTSDPRYFEVSDEELERWRLQFGDVLVIEGNGSADHIGRTALFKGEIEDCVHQNHVIRIRPNTDKSVPAYVNFYLNSPLGKQQMMERSRTTSGLFNLSVGRIKSLEIPIPSIPEQNRIVDYAESLQSKIKCVAKQREDALKEFDALLPAILDKAFKGEL